MLWLHFLHRPNAHVGRFIGSVAGLSVLFSIFYVAMQARAVQPTISKIEKFGANQVTIHFDTEANYTYTLQYSDGPLSNALPLRSWSNLFTISTPFSNHYVIVDYRTNKMRFYRLVATR